MTNPNLNQIQSPFVAVVTLGNYSQWILEQHWTPDPEDNMEDKTGQVGEHVVFESTRQASLKTTGVTEVTEGCDQTKVGLNS